MTTQAEVLQPPTDVRLMNVTASAVFMAVFVLLLAAALMWAIRNPIFAINRIVVEGSPQHSSALALQTNVMPRLQGTLFTMDLEQARDAFEQMPWVRNALISREFPATLKVSLEEHVPVALWEGSSTGASMINNHGEVFEANLGEVEHVSLPRLSGPEGQSEQVLSMYRALRPVFEENQMALNALFLTANGNWQAVLANNGVLELGAGNAEQVMQRLLPFLQSLPAALQPLQRTGNSLEYADLRHRNGYAIRLKGVVTGEDALQRQRTPARR